MRMALIVFLGAHGKDERVAVEAFYQATEWWYRLVKSFGAGAP